MGVGYIDRDGTHLTELAARPNLTHPSMSELVAGLVASGYLERADMRTRATAGPTSCG